MCVSKERKPREAWLGTNDGKPGSAWLGRRLTERDAYVIGGYRLRPARDLDRGGVKCSR